MVLLVVARRLCLLRHCDEAATFGSTRREDFLAGPQNAGDVANGCEKRYPMKKKNPNLSIERSLVRRHFKSESKDEPHRTKGALE